MKIHPREELLDKAERILSIAVRDVLEMDLTNAEYIQVLNTVYNGAIGRRLKYMIRYERHGNGDKPGGLE